MKAWELLDAPEKWCQHYFGLDSNGAAVNIGHLLKADRWCVEGAIMCCYGQSACGDKSLELTDHIKMGVIRWNDMPGQTWENVRATLKEIDL